jgi:predicted nucleic acid-binding protein
MIFLDANVLLRALTESDDPKDQHMSQMAGRLLRLVELGEVEVTTSDAVLGEVAFMLTARSHYNEPPTEAAAKMAAVLSLRSFKMLEKRMGLRGLEIWSAYPHLGFVDAHVAAYVEAPDMRLATLNTHFDELPEIVRWDFGSLT